MNVINGAGENKPKLVLICRLCGDASNSYVNIFGHEGTTHYLSKKILLYLKVEVSNSDLLPKIVCNKCFQKLEEFHNYFLASKKVQVILKNTIKDSLFSKKIKIGSLINEASSENTSIKTKKQNDNHIFISQNENENRSQASKVESMCHSMIDLKKNENVKTFQNNKNPNDKEMLPVDSIAFDFDYQEILDFLNVNDNIPETADQNKHKSISTTMSDNSFQYNNYNEKNRLPNESNNKSKSDLLSKSKTEKNSSNLESVLETDNDVMDLSVRLSCVICNEIFTKPRELIGHFNEQHCNDIPIFKCKICGNPYKDLEKFHIHYLNHEKDKYTCKICGKSFKRQWSLKLHAAVHTDIKFYNCDQCEKSYKSVNALRAHKKDHLPDKYKLKYNCRYCDKRFKSRFLLKSHEKNHTGQNFLCDICSESFVNKRLLRHHMEIHNFKENSKCRLCSKVYSTEKSLEKHLVTHSFEKPFKCEYCGKRYSYFSHLKEHRRLHTGELPYKCEDCPKRFRLRNALITHQRQHTGEKPFKCNTCNHAFTDFPNYYKHMKLKHNNANVIERNGELILLKN